MVNGNDDIVRSVQQYLQLYSMDINTEHFLFQLKMLDLKQVDNENNPSIPIKDITSFMLFVKFSIIYLSAKSSSVRFISYLEFYLQFQSQLKLLKGYFWFHDV